MSASRPAHGGRNSSTRVATAITVVPPSGDELVRRARGLVSALRARARECEERRALPLQTVEEFRRAGLFRILQPARFGGYEQDPGVLVEVGRQVAHGCGSSAWCLVLLATHSRLVGMFEDRAQREVFGDGGDALVAAVYEPTGRATAVAGGFRLSGRWRMASGCDHAGWTALAARVDRESEGPIRDIRCFLVPTDRVSIEDTWFAAGLRGTGTKDLRVEDVFVPAHRALSFVDVARGRPPGAAVNATPLFRLPVVPVLAMAVSGIALGLTEACIETFRGPPSPHGADPVQNGLLARALGQATATVDAAGLLVRRDVEELERRAAAGERHGRATRARYLLDAAFVMKSCTGAVDALLAAGGAGAGLEASPVQRASRDLHAMSAHPAVRFDAVAELFGRLALGLPVGSTLTLV